MRDYVAWHRAYDDPDSALSWRLAVVRGHLQRALDARSGPVHLLSACLLRGRSGHPRRAGRSLGRRAGQVTLIELNPALAAAAREAAAAAGLSAVEVRVADAGVTDSYVGAAPADVVLLVGVFGNITETDIRRTIAASPAFCRPGATLLWSGGRRRSDDAGQQRRATIRGWFSAAGFTEIAFTERDPGAAGDERRLPAIGVVRYDGPPALLEPGRLLFRFTR